LFWSEDPRFLDQFKDGNVRAFKPYSKYPICYKDTSFWTTKEFHDNDFMEVCRELCGDVVEKVSLIDVFEKKGRVSKCFRVEYRSMDRTLTNDEVDDMHSKFVKALQDKLKVEIR
jgi:phenylalanyl-tRNA synthetase alpha chain